jgi:hypothetical protein
VEAGGTDRTKVIETERKILREKPRKEGLRRCYSVDGLTLRMYNSVGMQCVRERMVD